MKNLYYRTSPCISIFLWQGEHIEDQVVHDEKPADELNRQPSTSDSDGCKKPTMSGDATFGGDAEHKQHFHEMQKECQSVSCIDVR